MDRMKYYEFSYKLTSCAKIKLPLASVLAPVLYHYEDRYYEACVAFLENGSMHDLSYENYSASVIMKMMNASYIEALMILHNIETAPELAPMIFVPEILE